MQTAPSSRRMSSSGASFSGRTTVNSSGIKWASTRKSKSFILLSPARHHSMSAAQDRKRRAVLTHARKKNDWGGWSSSAEGQNLEKVKQDIEQQKQGLEDLGKSLRGDWSPSTGNKARGEWASSVEGERLKREAELQKQRFQDLVQQQLANRPAWQNFLLPAVGAGFFALVLGPLFAVVLGAAALGSSLVFSTAAVFILVPLAVATLALTFGLSAGAFVIKGIAFSVFNLLLVGGALAAGFKLTSNLLGGTPKESVDRQAAKANSQNGPSDIEAKVLEDEARERDDAAKMNANQLRRFDEELEARTRQRDIDMGRRWKP